MSRPSKFHPEFVHQARALAQLGLTDEQMALVWSVSRSTVARWKRQQPQFMEALRHGKTLADAKVARALFEVATGYSHPVRKVWVTEGRPVVVDYTQHYAPDTKSMLFWLANRRRQLWATAPDPAGGDDLAPPVRVVVNIQDVTKPEPGTVHAARAR